MSEDDKDSDAADETDKPRAESEDSTPAAGTQDILHKRDKAANRIREENKLELSERPNTIEPLSDATDFSAYASASRPVTLKPAATDGPTAATDGPTAATDGPTAATDGPTTKRGLPQDDPAVSTERAEKDSKLETTAVSAAPAKHKSTSASDAKRTKTSASADAVTIKIDKRYDGGVLYWTAKLYVFAACIILVGLGIKATSMYMGYAKVTPDAPDWSQYVQEVPAISRIYAADNSLLAEFADQWRELAAYDSIPQDLVNAFLAAEDHEFYEHHGIYFRGIARAAWRNISAGDFAQGGSTITQQVAKQYLSSDKTLERKAKEAIMARRLERLYSKEAILSVYLNQIYLGNGAYGVKAAARRYFDKKLDELTIAEMATIAGLAQAPSRDSPNNHAERATRRRDEILDRMALHGYLEADEVATFKAEPLVVKTYHDIFGDYSPYYTEHVRRYVIDKYGGDALQNQGLRIEAAVEPVTDALAYDNVDHGVHKQDKRQGWRGPVASLDDKALAIFSERAEAMYGDAALVEDRRYLALVSEVTNKGATVQVGSTSYDLPLANMKWASLWSASEANNDIDITDARDALRVGDVVWVQKEKVITKTFEDWFLAGGANPHWLMPGTPERVAKKISEAEGRVVLDQVPHPQSAMFTGDHENGYVVAMVGGSDFDRSVYNRAYQACRQPGSTYKPIYYSAAFTLGYGYDTSLNDIPRAEIDPITGEVWVPENFQGTMDNKVTLEYALVFSKNVASIDVFKKVGADEVEAWARKLGFTTEIIADKALALGASCTLLHELTRAFAIFARNGRFLDWKFVRRIFDRSGNLIEDNTVYYDPMLSGADRLNRVAATAGIHAKQAIPERAAYLISKLLRQTIKSGFSSIVRATDIIAAGKTGTSSATMDNTFVAFTSRWITTVWMGDDIRQRPLGLRDAAYMTVEPMWARYMRAAAMGHPNKEIPWERPEGVREGDRGDHSKGTTYDMPLVYIKSASRKPPEE